MGKEIDYKKLGLKSGIEIHQQLNTEHKLFCSCKTTFSAQSDGQIARRLRAVAGELGEIDVAAQHEVLKGKGFYYRLYPGESCLVETDSEPPHELNRDALMTALQIALMLNCNVPDEIHVMRKTVIDGSDTSGFQRTAVVGLNGWVETSFGGVEITNVCLEEESSQILKREKNIVIYGLNRFGIPLIEIGTGPDIKNPEQARELAEKLGMILRSTGRVKTGLGTIRQDLNISIKGGERIEVKGVQSLDMIPKVLEQEALRQKKIISKRGKVKREVRKALPDGKTEFLRPLPGAARLYPETDIPPIRIDRSLLETIKLKLPELLDDRIQRYVREYGVHPELAKQLVMSGRADLFEFLIQWADPKILATTLTSTLKRLEGVGVKVENLTQKNFASVFRALKNKRIAKEAIPDVLKQLAAKPGEKIDSVIKKLGIETVSVSDLREIVRKVIKEKPEILKMPRPEKVFMGLIMARVRGRVPGETVASILAEELKKS